MLKFFVEQPEIQLSEASQFLRGETPFLIMEYKGPLEARWLFGKPEFTVLRKLRQ